MQLARVLCRSQTWPTPTQQGLPKRDRPAVMLNNCIQWKLFTCLESALQLNPFCAPEMQRCCSTQGRCKGRLTRGRQGAAEEHSSGEGCLKVTVEYKQGMQTPWTRGLQDRGLGSRKKGQAMAACDTKSYPLSTLVDQEAAALTA